MQRFEIASLRASALSLVFYGFFEASKHLKALAGVNPFAEDPYDGIGSIGVQLALFLAAISLLRSFRPQVGPALQLEKQRQIARGNALVAATALFTMLANGIAMMRHARVWIPFRDGRWLAAAVVVLGIWSVVELRRNWPLIGVSRTRTAWLLRLICIVSILLSLFIPNSSGYT